MGITVKDAIKIGVLANAKLIAGANGLNREIEHVTMMEVPEAVQWLKGKDLVLANNFALAKQRSQQSNYIQAMAAANVGALIVKNQSYIDGVFNVIIDVANMVGLPILEVGANVDYNDIIRPVMEAVINKESAHICRKIAEMTMVDNTLEERLDFLNSIWGYKSAVFNNEGYALALSPKGWISEEEFQNIKNKPLFGGTLMFYQNSYYYTAALRINDKMLGHWIICTGEKQPTAERIHDFENTVAQVINQMGKQVNLDGVKTRFSGELLEDLILGQVQSVEIAKRRADLLGMKLCPYYTIVTVSQKTSDNDSFNNRNAMWSTYSKIPGEILASVNLENTGFHAVLVGFPNNDENQIAEFCQMMHEMFTSYGSEQVFLGVGSIFEELTSASQSYAEAKEAMQIGKYFGKEKKFMFFNDMGIYKLLAQINNDQQLLDFVPKGLLKLQSYDIHSNIDLLKTLEAYLANGGNARKTAEELFVHYKTLQYRLDRIEDIAGLDLENGETRLEYHLGLKILNMLQAKNN